MDRLATLLRRSVADPRSDGQLLAAFLTDRDEVAFAELIRRHGPLVWGVCRRAFPHTTDAEDAFQATFLVLVRRAHSLTDSPTLGPWLFKVASWTVRSHRRTAKRHLAHELPPTLADPRPADLPPDFDAVLLGLPERCRAAVLLCHAEGLTHREAAERLGCPVGTVASLVARGLAKLRERFAGREPSTVLALLGATLPAALAEAAVRSAVSFQVASIAASPAVLALTHGVLRMFWIKKATATALAAVLLLAAGVGIGVSVRQTPQAVAQERPTPPLPAKPSPPGASADDLRRELDVLRDRLLIVEEAMKKLYADADTLKDQAKKLNDQRDQLMKQYKELQERRTAMEAEAKKKDVAARGQAEPYVVLTVRKTGGGLDPYTLTEFDASGKVMWGVIPGANLAEKPLPAGMPVDWKRVKEQQDATAIDAIAQYLKRLRATPGAPRDLRVVFEIDAPLGGFALRALQICVEAGFETIHFTGYIPFGGFIPELKPDASGEAKGYKRYKGEVIRTKKLLDEYSEALRRL